MAIGTVNGLNGDRGFGLITPDDQAPVLPVHHSAPRSEAFQPAAMSPPFLCELQTDWERAVVVPHGTLDATTFPNLEREVRRLCAAGFSAIVVDLRAVEPVAPTASALLRRLDELASRHQVTLTFSLQPTDADRLPASSAT